MSSNDQPALHPIPYDDFVADVRAVGDLVRAGAWQPDFVVGIGRGGLVPAVYISHRLGLPMLSIDHSARVPGFAEELLGKVAQKSADTRLLFVDDINDSGGTLDEIRHLLTNNGCHVDNLRFATLLTNSRSRASVDYWSRTIDRAVDKRWFVFPWEAMGASETIAAESVSVPGRLA